MRSEHERAKLLECELHQECMQIESEVMVRKILEKRNSVGLREELQRVEHELRDARHIERLPCDDLLAGRVSQSNFEQRLEDGSWLVAQLLDIAVEQGQNQSFVESAFSPHLRHSSIPEVPSPIDTTDTADALDALRAWDHGHFLDGVAKTGSVNENGRK